MSGILPASLADQRVRQRIGDFEIVDEVARGGMGVVFKARQTSLGRVVALKMMLFGGWGGQEAARRFRTEAIAAATLDHPNIVRVFQVGEHEGLPFIAMEYIDGPSLADAIRDRALLARDVARCVTRVARAIQFAHDHGVLHRDLKPSNILLDADGVPHVTDFGLAKLVQSETELTVTGQSLGSPNYASPEQIGETATADARSDIYGLGAIMYHALTGRPPFQGHSLADVLVQVRESNPIAPRQLDPGIPRDLETICLKCLAKEQEKRYPTALDLAEDLDRFLKSEPIEARPVTGMERAWRWCRRKPALAASLACSLLLLVTVLVGSPIAVYRIDRERQKAETQAYVSDMNVASQAWEEGNLGRAQALLNKHIPEPGHQDLRGFEWRYLWNLCRDESRFSFTNFTGRVKMILAPDGRMVVAASGTEIRVLHCTSHANVRSIHLPPGALPIEALAFSPADTNVLATLSGQTLTFWDLARKTVASNVHLANSAEALAFSRDGKLVATAGGYQRTIELWRIEDHALVASQNCAGPVFALLFAPDGKRLIHGGSSRNAPVIWDPATGESTHFPTAHGASIGAMAFSPDGKLLATSANDGTVVLWDFLVRKPVARLIARGSGSGGPLAFSPDGNWLATGNSDGTVEFWDVKSHQLKAVYRGHRSEVLDVLFSPDGRQVLSSSDDTTVKVWDLEPSAHSTIVTSGTAWVRTSVFSPNNKRLLTRTIGGGGLKVWDVTTRTLLQELTLPFPDATGPGGVSPDGKTYVLVSDRHIGLWDADFARRGILTNQFAPIALSFSKDSRILAVSGLQGAATSIPDGSTNRLAFWDLRNQREIDKLRAAAPFAIIVQFSHDGKKVAIGYLHGQVRVWDYEKERLLAEFTDHRHRLWAVTFSPDDTWLAAGGFDGVISFYNLRTHETFTTMQASTWCGGLCFSPDGKTLASADADGTVRLWNVATREIALGLKGHIGQVCMDLAFSSDGKYLTTCGADGTVRLWPAAMPEAIPRFRSNAR